jgi:hypothetical protein
MLPGMSTQPGELQFPRKALSVIDAFVCGNWQRITDNYLSGLFDAQAVIRGRYIESRHTSDMAQNALDGLSWRELEVLCGVAYEHMGYKVTVTPRSDDDGVDVFARSSLRGRKELIVIQARKWSPTNPVGKGEVRELLGTIDLHRATKGVLVTTGRYERGATQMAKQDPRIELLDRSQVLELLNEHCGSDWFKRVDRLLILPKRATEDEV